jgi:LPS-assembly protein
MRTKNFLVGLMLLSLSTFQSAFGGSCFTEKNTLFKDLQAKDISSCLKWIEDPLALTLCHGFYYEPPLIAKTAEPPPIDKVPITITATAPSLFSREGVSFLEGNVSISEPGREITADKITLYRNPQTEKLSTSLLLGNVRLQESGKLVVAEKGEVDFVNKKTTLNNAIYRIRAGNANSSNAWGKAKEIVRDQHQVMTLTNASYTTCAPNNGLWTLKGKKIILDKNIGRGCIYNSLLFFKGIPVAWTPYLSFPIDKKRKSGLLNFAFYSKAGGIGLAFPYYFNLASNYDLTLTPQLVTNRGVLFQGLFRYLTPSTTGDLTIGAISGDRAFSHFQEDNRPAYTANPTNFFLKRLEDASTSRGFFTLNNNIHYNPHWSSTLQLRYLSDDYFAHDFSNIPIGTNDNQLLNQFDLNYRDYHWDILARAQIYQTLYQLNQAGVSEQYRRLPELDLTGDFPTESGIERRIEWQLVNFVTAHDFDPATNIHLTNGVRMRLAPSIALPVPIQGGFITPRLQVEAIGYDLHEDRFVGNGFYPNPYPILVGKSASQALPLFSLDYKTTFSRAISLFHLPYQQTLEPRIFYLYVPVHNQDRLPVFDTVMPIFDYASLFHTNRFSGFDRVGDASQIALGFTSRLYNQASGNEKFHFSLGELFLLHTHHVLLETPYTNIDDDLTKYHYSPIVAEMDYVLTDHWNALLNAAWDPNTRKTDNSSITMQYIKDLDHVINLGYFYTIHGDPFLDQPDHLHRIDLSTTWALNEHWNLVFDWNYNISHNHPQTYAYGVEYQSCCWALRMAVKKDFDGADPNSAVETKKRYKFNTIYYLQFMLKGLGAFGTNDPGNMLIGRIKGYQNKFAGESIL